VEGRKSFVYEQGELTTVKMTPEQNQLVLDGMYAVVNAGGTATSVSLGSEFPIAGKTGTAQVTELGKDRGRLKDHAWFVGFAPAYAPELAVIALIENAGFGGTHAGPAVKKVFQAYINPGSVQIENGKIVVGGDKDTKESSNALSTGEPVKKPNDAGAQ
jgi:penicillin-binding protein 2